MRITNINSLQGISRPTDITARTKEKVAQGRMDAFTPSTLATDFNIARRAIVAAPEIREDRINDIMTRINAGEYNVSASDLAAKILDQLG